MSLGKGAKSAGSISALAALYCVRRASNEAGGSQIAG